MESSREEDEPSDYLLRIPRDSDPCDAGRGCQRERGTGAHLTTGNQLTYGSRTDRTRSRNVVFHSHEQSTLVDDKASFGDYGQARQWSSTTFERSEAARRRGGASYHGYGEWGVGRADSEWNRYTQHLPFGWWGKRLADVCGRHGWSPRSNSARSGARSIPPEGPLAPQREADYQVTHACRRSQCSRNGISLQNVASLAQCSDLLPLGVLRVAGIVAGTLSSRICRRRFQLGGRRLS
jgi:hypothetical protein